jgi:hypothetical protein
MEIRITTSLAEDTRAEPISLLPCPQPSFLTDQQHVSVSFASLQLRDMLLIRGSDVAAVGLNVLLYESGQPNFVGGTSASAPIFASIITLINEKRLAAGKSTVGFINPTLYKNPHAFTDVSFICCRGDMLSPFR